MPPGHERPVCHGRLATKRRAQVQPRETQLVVDRGRGTAFPTRELRDGLSIEVESHGRPPITIESVRKAIDGHTDAKEDEGDGR